MGPIPDPRSALLRLFDRHGVRSHPAHRLWRSRFGARFLQANPQVVPMMIMGFSVMGYSSVSFILSLIKYLIDRG